MQPLNDHLRSIPDDTAYRKSDLPIGDLAPRTPEGKRRLEFLKGLVEVPDEALFSADAEIEGMFYGDNDCES